MKGLVIIPTYNELGNIERIIPQIVDHYPLDVLVVDDNSPDGTATIVQNLPKFNERIFLLSRDTKDGLGRAYIAGFQQALRLGYDFVVQMDADLSHNPKDLQQFIDCFHEGVQAVFGSRYIGGVRVLDWDVKRLFLSIYANLYARITTGVPVSDLTGGFNAYTKEVLESIDFDRIHAKGYMFQIEMKASSYYAGFKYQEVPIVFIDRTIGETKLQGSIIYEAIFGCPLIRLRKIFSRLSIKKNK
ncbi:MAG: polyprenol monophosphomannose synthase [Brevinema sp.]